MPVLTQKQYDEMPKASVKVEKKLKLIEPAKSQPSKTYILMHPENEVMIKQNFEDELELNGIKYKRICKNGVVKTQDKPLADYLIKQQYKLLGELNG